MRTMVAVCTFVALIFVTIQPRIVQAAQGDKESPELHQLFSDYQQAVAAKDLKRLLGYFLNDAVPFVGAIAPASYKLISSVNKQPIPRTLISNAKDDASSEIKLPPDQIKNLAIQTDGEVGAVSWDYDAKMGHGRIVWSTVLTNDGWKIASVTYSINVPAASKP